MILIVVLCCFLFKLCDGNQEYLPNRYCAKMQPQKNVSIEQLTGTWYVAEIISHKPDEEHRTEYIYSCPMLHIYETGLKATELQYGSDFTYGYNSGVNTERTNWNREGQGMYVNRDGNRRSWSDGYDQRSYRKRKSDLRQKELKVEWDENGNYIEYFARYQPIEPGFWLSSGAQKDGWVLDRQFNNFAGTIQVFEAVGDRLVLNFCFQLPEQQLFTVTLSRISNGLAPQIITGVHSSLLEKGLDINIKRVCVNSSYKINANLYTFFFVIFTTPFFVKAN